MQKTGSVLTNTALLFVIVSLRRLLDEAEVARLLAEPGLSFSPIGSSY